MNIGVGISGAVFGDEKQYRYALWRIWDKSKFALLFIGLNPSTANATRDDPTIIRCANFAKYWGYGGLYVGNLFSLVSADPAVLFLKASPESSGGPNDTAIKQMRELSTIVLVGWGNDGGFAKTRPDEVLALVGAPVYCLGVTRSGEPKHPLYIASGRQPEIYERKVKE